MAENELPNAATLAYTFSEAVADQEGDAAQEYLIAFMNELFELETGVCEHFTGKVLLDLCEEIARREDPRYASATVELIVQIAKDWGQEQ